MVLGYILRRPRLKGLILIILCLLTVWAIAQVSKREQVKIVAAPAATVERTAPKPVAPKATKPAPKPVVAKPVQAAPKKAVAKPAVPKAVAKAQKPAQPSKIQPVPSGVVPEPGKVYGPLVKGNLSGVLVVLDPGHGGNDPGTCWVFDGETFMEAAYAQKMAYEAGGMIRQAGGSVVFTATSKTMLAVKATKDSLPKPTDAMHPGGVAARGGKLAPRKAVAESVLADFQSGKLPGIKMIAFFSLHIDSMGERTVKEGWQGLHARYHINDQPSRLAELVAQSIEDNGYARRKFKKDAQGKVVKNRKGDPIYEVVRPLDNNRVLGVLRNNVLRQRVLVELGIPGSAADSWRLRNSTSRQKMLRKVVLTPLVTLAKEKPWEQ